MGGWRRGLIGVGAAVSLFVFGWALLSAASGENSLSSSSAEPSLEAAFPAWLNADSAFVRLRPAPDSPAIGILRRGDRVLVTACHPDCESPEAWALLGLDGAIRLSLLQREPPSEADFAVSASAHYLYARVSAKGAEVYERPDFSAKTIAAEPGGSVLAFRQDDALQAQGWLARPAGGFVPLKFVRLETPSSFSGEFRPDAPLAFFIRDEFLPTPGCPGAPCFFASRFSRLPVLSKEKSGDYRVPGGIAPRKAVRIAYARPRPRGVGPEEKWVHVDLSEQVITAYEGDALVFATLVSTGKKETQTQTGLFRVWRKAIHEALQGEPEDPYLVEEVPFLLFFHKEQALHGTFWHEAFGTPASHGCVNLSMADAAWLFEWAPPRLPPGWHSITPEPAGLPTLWVQIERAAPGVIPARKISSSEISFP